MPAEALRVAAPRLARVVEALERAGANLTIILPGGTALPVGAAPGRTRVVFHDEGALAALHRGNHLALAEAFLASRVDVDGDFLEVFKITEHLDLETSVASKLGWLLRRRLPGRGRWSASAVAFHYDRPAEFFLPWFERWRSYSHGFYATPHDDPSVAQARKLQYAIDHLGLRAGMRVLDVGSGWGSFLEYAGRQGIRVHGLTLSAAQHRFVQDVIDAERLPCTIELVDVLAYRPPSERFDAAVLMGSFEHLPNYRRVVEVLAECLSPRAHVYADFCARHRDFLAGAFLRKHIWPGPASYVDLGRLVRSFAFAGFNVHELGDDTWSYAYTARDWARRLEEHRVGLAARFGEPAVRAFLLMLWASHHFLATNRTQAYHLVAARGPRVA
jgi:cyclopropane-fatty-acyl-phospholipid synthase